VASLEMLGPFGGVRPWVHPVLAGGVLFLMSVVPTPGRVITGVAALLLFPASLAALALTHRLIAVIGPVALLRVIAGMGGSTWCSWRQKSLSQCVVPLQP
jgi:hypothetical protein